jgi:hypothetical protein
MESIILAQLKACAAMDLDARDDVVVALKRGEAPDVPWTEAPKRPVEGIVGEETNLPGGIDLGFPKKFRRARAVPAA